MKVSREYSGRYVYHFTHISNFEGLIKTGLLANNHPDFPKNSYLSVAEKTIQERRANMKVTCGKKGVVHDYVPLYFSSLSPMLLAVLKKKRVDQEDIIYLEFPIEIIERHDFVFSSAAANTEQPPIFYDNSEDLNLLCWEEINSRAWKCATDEKKQQRMAELLIYNQLSLSEVERIVVWSNKIKKQLIEIADKTRFQLPHIQINDVHDRRHFFTDFASGNSNHSCVAGPKEVKRNYDKVLTAFQKRELKQTYPYENIDALLKDLRRDLSVIPYTKELIDLEVDNPTHKENVDQHVLKVVSNLNHSQFFQKLSVHNKNIVELSAFLHDIGKGPKSRWLPNANNNKNNGKQRADDKHPVRAAPMLIDIFCNYIKSIDEIDVRRITFLILYHDFIGDVMGGRFQDIGDRRDPEEINNNFKYNSTPIDMLFALSKADSLALSEDWWDDVKAKEIYDIIVKRA